MESSIRFISLNIGMKRNLAGLLALISDLKPDIVFLQEVVLLEDQLDCQTSGYGFSCKVNNAEDLSKPGIAILWRSSLPVEDVANIVVGRAQLALLGDYALLNIYAPSGSQARHARNVFFAQDLFLNFAAY